MSENGIPSPSQSQVLSASTTSLSGTSGKQISQIYKHASQLYLTRRLAEALSALEPLVTASRAQDAQENSNVAPVATASTNSRIKVWNLYITILSSIVELGPEEGKRQFGQKEWKALASRVREGDIWETVVQVGYKGREGSVDADVVYNLATLLLKHSPSQKLNQQRMESYLSSYGLPDLDLSAHLQDPNAKKQRRRIANGTDTPKDLIIRVRLLELFTLHILPRNDEWDYAREFINASEVLDEERRENLLQTLDTLLEEKERGAERAAELQREKEAELERQRREREEAEKREEEERRKAEAEAKQQHEKQKRAASEVDYGIDRSNPNGSVRARTPKPALKPGKTGSPANRQVSGKKAGAANATRGPVFVRRLRLLAALLVRMVKSLAQTLSTNPLAFLRTLVIVLGFVMALGRPDVRDRIRRITGAGWQKVRGTVGMGVKVSYI
ncbi:hypothetical protein VTO42DRAFT_3102 [Malbranchea cinnamomea]